VMKIIVFHSVLFGSFHLMIGGGSKGCSISSVLPHLEDV
jgi:hypothetical protein